MKLVITLDVDVDDLDDDEVTAGIRKEIADLFEDEVLEPGGDFTITDNDLLITINECKVTFPDSV